MPNANSAAALVTQQVEPQAPVVHAAIDVRSVSLAVLAILGVIVFVRWASPVLIPIATAVLLSYALTPIVTWLQKRLRLPKVVGAAITLGSILLVLGFGLTRLQPQALDVLDIVPRAVQKLGTVLRGNALEPENAVDKMKKAAKEIEKAANEVAAPSAPALAPAKLPQAAATFNVGEYMLTGTASLITGAGQFFVVICLVYFLLITGDAFRRTLVRVSGDTLSEKKITVQILDEIDSQIQRYLLVQLATSVLLGAVAWAVFAWIGLNDAVVWGCLGAILHLVPYIGPTAFVAVTALVAFVQFDTIQPVVIVVGSVLTSIGITGLILVPWLTQRVGRLKAIAVFVALLAWGWMWGVWGLLLGVPIVMAINAVCERVEELQPISEFLTYRPSDATSG